MIPPTTSVLITHAKRDEAAKDTLAHLETAGFRPRAQRQAAPPASFRQRLNVRDALGSVPWAGGVLMFEDDVRLLPHWRRVLEVVQAANHPTVCCCMNRANLPRPWRSMTAAAVQPTVAPLVRPLEYAGGQCVYLPEWFLPLLWADERLHEGGEEGTSFDALLNLMARDPEPVGLMIAVPDVVRHLSLPRVRYDKTTERRGVMEDWRLT